ncbi:hypothetical protein [Mesorhizobium sp. M1399]|uniref:hypothetical protein n=1 Tax=Mesorhizobium sp. M1399 TaxID=2957096 RepID=UPI00333B8DF3
MFVREKNIRGYTYTYTYLYLVESVREEGRMKQRIVHNLGRKDAVLASGDLDRLAASVGRYAERAMVLQAIQEDSTSLHTRRIGAPLLFGRLWEDTGCRAVIEGLLTERKSSLPSNGPCLLPCFTASWPPAPTGPARSGSSTMTSPAPTILPCITSTGHGLARRGTARGAPEQCDAILAAHCEDEIEETLFAKRKYLFTDLSVVFMDTSSPSFDAPAAPRSAPIAIPRTIGPISTR